MSGAEVAVPLFASVIGAGATLLSSQQQAEIAQRAERQRREQQTKLEAEQAKKEQQAALEQEKNIELSKKKTKAATQGGRADTILTSPLGVVGDSATAGKTLLGS